MSNKRLLIDFDRVVHKYSRGWYTGTIYDVPVDGAIEAIKKLQNQGWQIIIFTTRSQLGDERNDRISIWLSTHGIPNRVLAWIDNPDTIDRNQTIITNTKIPARAIIDDRAIRFTNWRDILSYFI